MWHDSFTCVMSHLVTTVALATTCTHTVNMWHDSFVRNMTRSYVTWFVHMCHESSWYYCSPRYYHLSHLGWDFRKLCQSSKLKARTSFLPRFSEKRQSSFELSDLIELSKMSSQMGLAVHACIQSMCDTTHSYVTWLIRTWHDSFMCDTNCSHVIVATTVALSLYVCIR